MRTTKTHDDIPTLRGALVQSNHRFDHLQGRPDLFPPFRGQSRLRLGTQTMDRDERRLEEEVSVMRLVDVAEVLRDNDTYKT